MAQPPRVLILDGDRRPAGESLRRSDAWDEVSASSLTEALARVRAEPFDALVADPNSQPLRDEVGRLLRAERVVGQLADGVALLDGAGGVVWANAAFARWCEGDPAGRPLLDALGGPEVVGPDRAPLAAAIAGRPVTARLHQAGPHRYLQLRITPALDSAEQPQLIVLCYDATAEVVQQQKTDALRQAGLELSGLSPEQLSDLGVAERVELLKLNLRRSIHDLLRYDVIEIRLLDRETGRLVPLLQEGMTDGAAARELFASPEGNGVTGLVAATGTSYVCRDTATDPYYIEGAEGARSSLTVPLIAQDQVIGTFNIESPRPNAFGPEEVQFTELFSREIAQALLTLELLSTQQSVSAVRSIEAVRREVALPVDDLLAAANGLLQTALGRDAAANEQLKRIIAAARQVKGSIQKVGDDFGAKPDSVKGKPTSRLRGLRVLVADADERVRRSAHNILERFGCSVETARTGGEALAMAANSGYDAVLADIKLPDLRGYEAFCRFRESQPQGRVILMTGFDYDGSHSIIRARQEGLRYVLYKPFRVDQLLEALTAADPQGCPPRPEGQPEVIQAS